VNFSGKLYQPVFYGVERATGRIDFDKIRDIALRERPRLIIAGASAYARDWDYATLRTVAEEVGALLMADIAHPAGLIAAGLLADPMPHCHVVTTTTHKTLRGPRGGLIMMGRDFDNPFGKVSKNGSPVRMSALLDGAVFPGSQGGPLMHIVAAKAVAFGEALQPEFKHYGQQVIRNAQAIASTLMEKGYTIVSDGTDNHLLLVDLRSKGLNGKIAEEALVAADITVNKNMVPFDTESPFVTSGIRIGSAAVTSRGLREPEMRLIAEKIDQVLQAPDREEVIRMVRGEIHEMMHAFPLQYAPVPDLEQR
jgi:glycine hydroxymethyltransferase